MTTIRARFDGQVFVPEQPVNLPRGAVLELDIRQIASAATPLANLLTLAEEFPSNPDAPSDRAVQHEHYLYGAPRQP